MAITVNITGIGPNFENVQQKFLTNLRDVQLQAVAEETQRIIRDKIRESLQRPGSTDNLAMSFFAEKSGTDSWGVGNINYLNSNAKYWKWLNYGVAGTGRRIPPATMGAFNPGGVAPNSTQFRQGRWTGGGEFMMIPQKPIEPHNFIERTLSEIPSIIHRVLGK